jgi:hypothetical protein
MSEIIAIELLNGHDLNEKQTSPEFFCINNTSNAVCHVSINGGDHVTIYCDGDMRIILDDQDIYDCYELIDAGITTDVDLMAVYDEDNGSRIIMNPWFDIYDSNGEHLDIVGFDIYGSIEDAKIYLRERELSNDKKTEV